MTFLKLELALRDLLRGLEQPAFEARQILLAVAGLTAADLILRAESEVPEALASRALEWGGRRSHGYPLAYLSGRKGFYKHVFFVKPGVLIPRPESEHVIEAALARAHDVSVMADLGCGTGCLGLSLLAELNDARLFAVDSSPLAIATTKRNAEAMGLFDRVTFKESAVESWTAPSPLDLVVANPPYIAVGDREVQESVHRYEPHTALYSGVDGLEAIRAWTHWADRTLRPGGLFVCEIGAGQSQALRDIMSDASFGDIEVTQDLAGHARVVSALKKR